MPFINEFGDGPIEPPSRGNFYGDATLSPACFASLRRIALSSKARDIDLAVAMTPLSPDWKRQHDSGGRITQLMQDGLEDALRGTGASLVRSVPRFERNAFFDAIHIRWSSTPEFTKTLLEHLRDRGTLKGSGGMPQFVG